MRSGKTGNKIPPPLATTLYGKNPNEVIHSDYLFLGDSDTDNKYVLAFKDDLIGYFWLSPTSSSDARHTADVLARWSQTFSTPNVWVSDQSSLQKIIK